MKQLSNLEISNLCKELAMLAHSGMSMADGMQMLAEEEAGKEYKNILSGIAEDADCGMPLGEAFEKSGAVPPYVSGLITVGERSGRQEQALTALSEYYEYRERLNQTIRHAVFYPIILLILMLIVVGVLITQVLPVFEDVYASLGGQLGGVARALLVLGQGLRTVFPVLAAVVVIAAVAGFVFLRSPQRRRRLLQGFYARHGDRGVLRMINTARFAQAFSMGMQSGLPIEEAFQLAASFQKEIPSAFARYQACLGKLSDGTSLSEAVKDIFPAAYCRMLVLGVRSGSGDVIVQEISRRMTQDSEQRLERIVNRIEPTLVLMTALIVGVILLSVMLPLMHIMSAIG